MHNSKNKIYISNFLTSVLNALVNISHILTPEKHSPNTRRTKELKSLVVTYFFRTLLKAKINFLDSFNK